MQISQFLIHCSLGLVGEVNQIVKLGSCRLRKFYRGRIIKIIHCSCLIAYYLHGHHIHHGIIIYRYNGLSHNNHTSRYFFSVKLHLHPIQYNTFISDSSICEY
jgi:hypothetical protein